MSLELSADDARRMALRAQGLSGGRISGGVTGMLDRLGAVQLDTISVLARSHELVAYSRLGPIGRDRVERGYWGARRGAPARTFEYWSHAACLLPIAAWPQFEFRRRHYRRRGWRWHQVDRSACNRVLQRLAAGSMTTGELGGGRRGGEWWDWSDAKIAVEWLLDIGEVTVTRREGWRRVYDLTERAIPSALLGGRLSDTDCLRGLVQAAGRTLGVATVGDLADVHRLTRAQVLAVLSDTDLVAVTVPGWRGPVVADPGALAAAQRPSRTGAVLLSPFDSLVWDRDRTERIFGMRHRLEAYVPAAQREHGYFAMPLLVGGRLCGRVDPKRDGTVLHARRVGLSSIDERTLRGAASALRSAAEWTGCEEVRLGAVSPAAAAAPLAALLR